MNYYFGQASLTALTAVAARVATAQLIAPENHFAADGSRRQRKKAMFDLPSRRIYHKNWPYTLHSFYLKYALFNLLYPKYKSTSRKPDLYHYLC